MRNLWLVARREFTNRGRSSAYIISTVMVVAMLFFMTLFPAIMENRAKTEPLHVLLLDQTGAVAEPLKAALSVAAEQPGSRPTTLEPVTGPEAALRERVLKEKVGLLIVAGSFPDKVTLRYLGATPGNMTSGGAVIVPAEAVLRSAVLQQSGVDPALVQRMMRPAQIEMHQLTASGEERSQRDFAGSLSLAMGVIMTLYMVVLINGQFIFLGILEEKVSRVVEVMASTVSAGEMLAGKVLGLGALGVLQFLAMVAARLIGTRVATEMAGAPTEQPVGIGAALVILAFMVLGFLLISALMAAAAATISKMEDQQAVMMPVIFLVVIPMMLFPAMMNDPNGSMGVALSLIPFASQFLMPFRMMLTEVPAWQIALSLLLLLVTTMVVTWAGGRVYRAALLSYGGRPTLQKVWSYLKAG